MVNKSALLKPASLVLLAGGLITLISSIFVFLIQNDHVTILVGLPAILLYILLASMEITSAPPVFRAEFGSWRGTLTALTAILIFRIFIVLLATDQLIFWMNAIIYILELLVFLMLIRSSEAFQITEEEKIKIDRCVAPAMRTVSACPSCHEVVETFWQSCPYCGTKLPRICATCGKDMGEMLSKCPHCGAEVSCSDSIKKTIDSFQALAKEDVMPETKATRYARLAEALLKDGQTDEAVVTYKKAVGYTNFKRKKANFLLRAAIILKNTGHTDSALDLLDEISSLDPTDEVGSKAVRDEILNPPKPSSEVSEKSAAA